jgi:glycosidase
MQTPKWAAETGNGETWANTLVYWERTIKARNPRAISAPFLSNHDKGRPSFSSDYIRNMTAALYLLAPGTPFIYYGEEIGMVDHHADDVYEDWDHRGPMWWSNTNQELTPNPPENLDWAVKAPPSGLGVEEQLSPRYFDQAQYPLGVYVRVLTLKNLYPWMAAGYHAESVNLDTVLSVMRYANPDNPAQTILVVQNTGENRTITLDLSKVKKYSWVSATSGSIGIKQPVESANFEVYGATTYIFQEYDD